MYIKDKHNKIDTNINTNNRVKSTLYIYLKLYLQINIINYLSLVM